MDQSISQTNESVSPVIHSSSVQTEKASFGKRLLAYWIDSLIVGIISFSLSASFSFNSNFGMVWFPGILLSAAYFIFFWMKGGQTLGNRLLAIKVVREDGLPMDVTTGVLRYVGYILSSMAFYLGFLWVLWDPKKQGWHDKIAKTVVVKAEGKSHVKIAVTIVVFILIGTFLLIAAFGAAIFLLFKDVKKNPDIVQKFEKSIEKSTGGEKIFGITQEEADELADETFYGINNYRKKKGLPELQFDGKLCAYSQRRLEQISALNKYDDGKGFYEDMANSNMVTAYFSDYLNNGESFYPVSSLVDSDDIVKIWAGNDNKKNTANIAEYNNGCIRANTQFMILTAAASK